MPNPVLAILATLTGLLPLTAYSVEYEIHPAILGDYISEIGPTPQQSKGLMIEIAAAAFAEAGVSVKMGQEVPWARAQLEAAEDPGGILVILARTPLRESLWNWVSTIYVDRIFAYTMPGHPSFASFDDLKEKSPAIGVKLATASYSILQSMGVPVNSTADPAVIIRMLILGRLDVVLSQGMQAPELFRDVPHGPDGAFYRAALNSLVRIPVRSLPLWLAVSKKMPEPDAERLASAVERFKTTDHYREIVTRYEAKIDQEIN